MANAPWLAGAPQTPREITIRGLNYDGSTHWEHPAQLVQAHEDLLITQTRAGLAVTTETGVWTSPFDTRAYYWVDRYYNVIRLRQPDPAANFSTEAGREPYEAHAPLPGAVAAGWYCNIATPATFDGSTLSYVDLQLDMRVYLKDGAITHEVVDEDEFEAARERYGYDAELVAKCRAAVNELIALVEAREFPFDR